MKEEKFPEKKGRNWTKGLTLCQFSAIAELTDVDDEANKVNLIK